MEWQVRVCYFLKFYGRKINQIILLILQGY